MTVEEENNLPFCCECFRQVSSKDELLGGRKLEVIIPSYKGCLKQRAGYVHSHGDRPAEKISVSVPRGKA